MRNEQTEQLDGSLRQMELRQRPARQAADRIDSAVKQMAGLTRVVVAALAMAIMAILGFAPEAASTFTITVNDDQAPVVGEPFTIDLRYVNDSTSPVTAISNGFRIYSPDGAVWQTPISEVSAELSGFFDGGVFLNEFSVDGMGADTIGLAAISIFGSGLPAGYDDVVLSITTQLDSAQVDKTICIDSSFFPPGGTWTWITDEGEVAPSWSGPHCWMVPCPLPEPIASFELAEWLCFDEEDVIIYATDSENETSYFLEVYRSPDCDENVEPGSYWSSWFSGTAGIINLSNLYSGFAPGRYHIKLAVQNGCYEWVETVKCITLLDCDTECIDFETLPPDGDPTTDMLEIYRQYQYVYPGLTFSLANDLSPKIAKVGLPKTAFIGPGGTYDDCDIYTGTGADMPHANFQEQVGCSFLTDGQIQGLPSSLIVNYLVPVTEASGDLLDIDFQEAWTITAFLDGNWAAETIIAPGTPGTGNGVAYPWTIPPVPVSGVFFDRLVFEFTGYSVVPGLAFDNFCPDYADTGCDDLNEVLNTGWDGQLIQSGDPDDDWRLVGTSNGPIDEPAQVINYSYGGWIPDSTNWLGIEPGWADSSVYWFEYTFCLNPDFSNAELQACMIGSETMWLYLNGNLIHGPMPPLTGICTFTTNQSFFQGGTNSLRVRLNFCGFNDRSVICPPAVFALSGTVFAENGECCDTGACCDTMHVCYQTDQETCLEADGIFFGKDTDCADYDCDTCFATGDIDGDGVIFTIADKIHLMNFVQGVGAPPIPLYQGDLNADGYIDQLDIDMIDCYIINGLSCFPQYPIPVDCFPSVLRGACCYSSICTVLSPDNCAAIGGTFYGLGTICDPNPCPDGICVGMRGNVNGDTLDQTDVSDLTYLVEYLFNGGPEPPNFEEADVNGDGSNDVADLTYLVDYLFGGGSPPVSCDAGAAPTGKVREDVIIGYEYRDGNTIVSLESSIDIRGVMLELTGEQADEPVRLVDGNFELLYHRKSSNEARLGLVDLRGPSIIKAGTHQLVSVPGRHEITAAMLSDANHQTVIPTIGMVSKGSGLPTRFDLNQNYPNPFNPSTSIAFSLPEASDVMLEVFNVLGQKVATLAEERFEAGDHTVHWDASSVSSGMYLYRLTAGDFTETKKMLLLK